MSRLAPTFIDLCLQGEAFTSEIDDYVDAWHESGEEGQSLAEYLGMTETEYALWVERPSSLSLILCSQKHELTIDKLLRFTEGQAIAARASSPEEVSSLVLWLKKTKRISE